MHFKFAWWDVVVFGRPSRNIGPDYLHRYHLIPKNPYFNIYLHCFHRSDYDRALHDHPWWSLSFLLKGKIDELYEDGEGHNNIVLIDNHVTRTIKRWKPYYRTAKHSHRIILKSEIAWTLFVTGKKEREWGFHTDEGWVHKDEFFRKIGYEE